MRKGFRLTHLAFLLLLTAPAAPAQIKPHLAEIDRVRLAEAFRNNARWRERYFVEKFYLDKYFVFPFAVQ